MQVDKNKMDDLEYLSSIGFEKVVTSDADVDELNSKIKSRVFSYNNGPYFGFISLIVGIFIGLSFFFMIANKQVIFASKASTPILNDTSITIKNVVKEAISLDTVTVSKENFMHPNYFLKHASDTADVVVVNSVMDSAASIFVKPIDPSLMLDNQISESKLKYISNAPVVYIQDLKVTDYTTLYFRKNQYVKFPVKDAVPVSYANKEDYNKNRIELKQNADYYLHEELSEALLLFKKGKYEQCLYALNAISTYNNSDLNCDFYSGMCYYYKKNYAKAVDFFNHCIESPNNSFLQEASYYKAVALYESGEKQVAIEKFKEIAHDGEFYSEKAKVFLKN